MKWYTNMKVAAKLLIAFLVIAIIAGGVGLFGILSLSSVDMSSAALFQNKGNAQGDLGYVVSEFHKQRALVRDIILDKDATKEAKYKEDLTASQKLMSEHLNAYAKTCKAEDEKALLSIIDKSLTDYNNLSNKISAFADKGDYDSGYAALREDSAKNIVTSASDAIDKAFASTIEAANSQLDAQSKSVNATTLIMIILVVLAVAHCDHTGAGRGEDD